MNPHNHARMVGFGELGVAVTESLPKRWGAALLAQDFTRGSHPSSLRGVGREVVFQIYVEIVVKFIMEWSVNCVMRSPPSVMNYVLC